MGAATCLSMSDSMLTRVPQAIDGVSPSVIPQTQTQTMTKDTVNSEITVITFIKPRNVRTIALTERNVNSDTENCVGMAKIVTTMEIKNVNINTLLISP